MLKIITSVVLSLVTIMAVTLFAVTVPAQSQKIEENAAAIASNETYIKTVDDALENLQEAFDVLDAKKTYLHAVKANIVGETSKFIYVNIYNHTSSAFNQSSFKNYINGKGYISCSGIITYNAVAIKWNTTSSKYDILNVNNTTSSYSLTELMVTDTVSEI